MRRRTISILIAAAVITFATSTPALAQPKGLQIGGYAMVSQINFAASESFDAVLGTSSGTMFGGGGRVGLPWFGLFVEVGASQFKKDGDRVLIADGVTYPLGIPVTVTVTPFEITGGYQFRGKKGLWRRILPYGGGGYSSYGYKETSTFAAAGEDADDRFSGYHLLGGVEVKLLKWLGVAGEAAWATIPDAIGTSGVSKAFGETDLGGSSFRFKITVGQ